MRSIHALAALAATFLLVPAALAGPLAPAEALVNDAPDDAEREAIGATHPLPGQGPLRPGVHANGDRTYTLFVDFDGDGALDEDEAFATTPRLANPKVMETREGVLVYDDADDDGSQDEDEPGLLAASRHDADGDGWSNEEEVLSAETPESALLGWLDPARTPADPDGDGVPTREERCYGTSPHDPESRPVDTDGDGVNDSPCSDHPDTYPGDEDDDGDGLSDDDEAACGTDPKSGDTDGDGVGDADEEACSAPGGAGAA